MINTAVNIIIFGSFGKKLKDLLCKRNIVIPACLPAVIVEGPVVATLAKTRIENLSEEQPP